MTAGLLVGVLSLLKTGLLYGCCELPETVSRLSAYSKESNHEQHHLARWSRRDRLVYLGILGPTLKAPVGGGRAVPQRRPGRITAGTQTFSPRCTPIVREIK